MTNWPAVMILIAGCFLIEAVLYLAGVRGNTFTALTLIGCGVWGFALSLVGIYVRKGRS